jgi:hypothetical protein
MTAAAAAAAAIAAAMLGEGAPLGLLRLRGASPVVVGVAGVGGPEWLPLLLSALAELFADERFDFGVDGSDGDVDDVFADDEFDVLDVLFDEV